MELFGTDGIRGEAGVFPLDPETLPWIGRAIGERLGGRILIGRDTRESGLGILKRLANGIAASGAVPEDTGVLPTPAVALLAREGGRSGGIVISASHNPYQDNGIKVFGPDGRKLDDAAEETIEARIVELRTQGVGPPGEAAAQTVSVEESVDRYAALLGARFDRGSWLDGVAITLDCANGAMSQVAPRILESLGARVRAVHSSPTGRNINAGCGAVHPESLLETVAANDADLGVAYDGDGDRAMFASASGRLVDGDAVLLTLARFLQKQQGLNPAVVVGTSMTNYNLERKLSDEGVRLIRVGVGDRYIFREMQAVGGQLGGEPSGHVIFSDFGLSGDGLLTTLKLLEVVSKTGRSLDELTADWEPSPQLLDNVRVRERVPLDVLPAVVARMRAIEGELAGRGRLVVRYSGTEPLLRVMVESDSAQLNRDLVGSLIETFRRSLGDGVTGDSAHAESRGD
jgi:phosphoglucosamine mutase